MPRSLRSKQHRLAARTTDLMLTAPLVMAARTTRLFAAPGGASGPHAQAAVARMASEKAAAFGEAWLAMSWQAWQSQQAFAASLLRAWWSPPWLLAGRTGWPSSRMLQSAQSHAWLDMLARGLTPVHRRVRANASRLRRR